MTAHDNLNTQQFTVGSYGEGDAVPGGYNGTIRAHQGGKEAGHLDYQSATHEPGFGIAMIKTEPGFERQGVASHLLKGAMREMPGPVNPGMMTPDGSKWWAGAGKSIAETYKPPKWSPEPMTFPGKK